MVINFECGLLRWLVRVEGGRFVLGNVCHIIMYVMISYYRKEAKISLLLVIFFLKKAKESKVYPEPSHIVSLQDSVQDLGQDLNLFI